MSTETKELNVQMPEVQGLTAGLFAELLNNPKNCVFTINPNRIEERRTSQITIKGNHDKLQLYHRKVIPIKVDAKKIVFKDLDFENVKYSFTWDKVERVLP
ncbi:hypothetical protein ACFL23_01060 [Patescibacteria group bacterium]